MIIDGSREIKKLNIGCGRSWREQYPDYEGLDIIDFGQKYVADAIKQLPIMAKTDHKQTYDEIMANHFLEHLSQDENKIIFKSVYNLLLSGGLFKIVVPHMDKPQSWVLSHKTFWRKETFEWLTRDDADQVYGFGTWSLEKLAINRRKDIHAWLRKN